VRRQLLGTPGVSDVATFGGELKQYKVAVNPSKLKVLNISISDVFTALENNNENTQLALKNAFALLMKAQNKEE